MGAGKNKTRRKKRISKHILKAQPTHPSNTAETPTETDKPTIPKKHEKHPSEVLAYLSQWKHSKSTSDPTAWKFNKNTQSWLIRYMYNSDKIPKSTFALCTEYICGIQSENLINRIVTDASRRIVRYKSFVKQQENKEANDDDDDDEKKEDSRTKELKIEDEEWQSFSDNDKRKEYKRTRKIIEALRDRE